MGTAVKRLMTDNSMLGCYDLRVFPFEIAIREDRGECQYPEKDLYDVRGKTAHELVYEHDNEQAQAEGGTLHPGLPEKDQFRQQLAEEPYPSEGGLQIGHGRRYTGHLSRGGIIGKRVYQADQVLT